MATRSSNCIAVLRAISRRHVQREVQSRAYASKTASGPLYPSVEVLLHTHNLSASDIQPTGPQGRLLKGDVLAHLGKIPSSAPKATAERFSKLSHLDLSNITLAAPKEKAPEKTQVIPEAEEPEDYELALPIDLKPVLKLQQRLQDTLGHAPPLPELLARAIGLANTDLPASSMPPSADELFEDILGLSSTRGPRLANGNFLPLINNAPSLPVISSQPIDLFDELVGAPQPKRAIVPRPLESGSINEFTVTVTPKEEKRAMVFLQRMKSVLEVEPGRLVL